jgi:hypothetical protein
MDGSNQPSSSWQQAERLGQVEPTGWGSGFFEDPAPLIERAGQSGVDEALLRVPWARVAPREGYVDAGVLDRYVEIVRHLRSKGLAVGVVLSDGSLPGWMGPEGWLLPSAPERFSDYADAVMGALGPDITTVITFEEPARAALAGWTLGIAPPFRVLAAPDSIAVLDNMMAGHHRVARRSDSLGLGVEVAYVASPAVCAVDLEGVVLGDDVGSLLANQVRRWSPGRAAAGGGPADAFSVIGVGPAPRPVGAGTLARALQPPRPVTSPEAVRDHLVQGDGASRRASRSLVFRHVAAVIDQKGRRTEINGHRRAQEIRTICDGAMLAAQAGSSTKRIVVGELVDRWSLGSYRWREGLVGVDRTRGLRGVTMLTTDSAGVDALGELKRIAGGLS